MADREVLSLKRADDDKLREHSEKRFDSMWATRKGLDADAYEIAGLCMPERSRQIVENHRSINRSASSKVKLFDSHSIRAFEVLANGMLSGLSSRSRPWRKSILEDDDLMKFYPVRVWMDALDKLVYSTLAATNFYEAMLSCYTEMGAFGTGAVIMQNCEGVSPKLVCHALTFGEYAIATGIEGRPDSLCRAYSLTCRQIVESFVASRFDRTQLDWSVVSNGVKEAWDGGHYERTFPIRQMIEPNPAYIPGKLGKIGMPFRSMKWEAGQPDKKKFLAIEGYQSQPFMAPRWETLAGDIWGTGRGKKALPDMRALQMQAKRKGEATDMAVKPPTWGPPSLGRVSMVPGAHTTVAAVDAGKGVAPIYTISYQVIEVVGRDVEDARKCVDRMAYVDLFMAITSMEGIQPRNIEELAKRHEEQLSQLGPVTDRVNFELLQPANDRAIDILAARGDLLHSLPPPPMEIQDMEIKADFVSVLAQAQKMIGISQTERAVGFIGQLAATFPEAIDNVDPDALVSDYWERSGAPAGGLRDPKQRDELRAQRAKAQQAQQAMQTLPAVRDGADAARLLSEADMGGGGSLLDRIVGQ